MKIRIPIIFLILIFVFLGCKNPSKEEYPDIIKKYNLEELYDKAKWEIYKLNSIGFSETATDYVIGFNKTDSIYWRYISLKEEYSRNGNFLWKDRAAIEQILGKENVKDFIDLELELFERDSSDIFKGEEIYLSLFPICKKRIYWQKPSHGHYCSIIFKDNIVIRTGQDDYYEMEYSLQGQYHNNKIFEKFLESKENIKPWLIEYNQKINYKN